MQPYSQSPYQILPIRYVYNGRAGFRILSFNQQYRLGEVGQGLHQGSPRRSPSIQVLHFRGRSSNHEPRTARTHRQLRGHLQRQSPILRSDKFTFMRQMRLAIPRRLCQYDHHSLSRTCRLRREGPYLQLLSTQRR